jgi:glycosyltransferase 2 family protein
MTPGPSKKQVSRRQRASRQTAVRILGTLIALALLAYLLSQQGWQEIVAAIHQMPLWRLALATVLMFVSRVAVAARWHVLLRAADPKISFRQSLRINFAGLFASNFLPTTIGGDVVRLAGAIQYKLDAATSTASLVVDRLIGMAGMAMMVPFSLPSLLSYRQASFQGIPDQNALAAIPLGKWWRSAWEKLSDLGTSLLKALTLWFKHPEALWMALFFSGVHMLCLFFIMQLLLGGIGEYMPLWLIGGLYSLVYFVTLIPISVNGYGLQEISMTLIFSNLGNASMSNGLTIALLFRTLTLIASLPGALSLPDILATAERAEAVADSEPMA